MTLDFEKYRGLYKCDKGGVLIVDYRKWTGNVYEIYGKLNSFLITLESSLNFVVERKDQELGRIISSHRFKGKFKNCELEAYNISPESANEFKGEVRTNTSMCSCIFKMHTINCRTSV